MERGERTQVLADVAERVALSNEFRSADFQDHVVRLVNDAREHWRDEQGELPRPRTDPTFDALIGLADAAGSAPMTVRDAAARALQVAEDVRVAP
jgi:hypothetical protein